MSRTAQNAIYPYREPRRDRGRTNVPPPVENEREIRIKLKSDLSHYSSRCLKIRTKNGSVEPLTLNSAQLFIHSALENQLKTYGRIRALILKGRQQGSSTYVEARYFHKVTHRKGVRAFILTHEDEATKNIFEMAERFYTHCPQLVKPSAGASNAKELYFDKLDSGYRVGTARTKGTGRSATLQYFHGSEVAYWQNAEEHMAGVLQAVPDEPGTEIILESTSAGAQGEFHRLCYEALSGQGEYILIFVPWFWQEEYRATAPPDFARSSDEDALVAKYHLTNEHLMWRREKVRQLGSVYTFRREYPCDSTEAFALEVPGALWKRDGLDATRVAHYPPLLRKVVGVDAPGGSTEAGIVVGGISQSKHVYIFDDRSGAVPPEVWGQRAIDAYDDHECDAIVYEANYGGDMVASVLKTAWKTKHGNDRAPLVKVWAAKSKQARAEPISILWTEIGGLAGHIVGRLVALEDELCSWVPLSGMESPNRLDAAVWTATSLLGSGARTGIPKKLMGALTLSGER